MRRRFFGEPCSRGLTSAHLDTPGTDEALEGVQWHFSEEAGAVAGEWQSCRGRSSTGRGQAEAELLPNISLATLLSCLFSLSFSYPFSGQFVLFLI